LSRPSEFETISQPSPGHSFWAVLRAPDRPEATELERLFISENEDKIAYRSVDSRLVVVHISDIKTE
jgi:hypothetical protein